MNTLVAVNVGLPREMSCHGRTVRTAIWKWPVGHRVIARHLNLDGDGQGDLLGHGGEHRAVMVYQLESYRYWQAHFGESGYVHGQFGENFTVAGLPDSEVCIGDQFRIGSARFEVTQPRVAGGLAIALMGCGTEQPQSTVSRELVSGVTSSNGGGMVPGNFSTFAPTAVSGVSFDTGNMAYPDPLPQGNLGTTRVR